METLDDLEAQGVVVGVRVDINSPLTNGNGAAGTPKGTSRGLADDARLQSHVGTISELLRRDARVAILAHQGRPGGDDFTDLAVHAQRLDDLVDQPVGYCDGTFSSDARDRIVDLDLGEAVLLENTRFYSEEYMEFDPADAADTYLVDRLSAVLDAYVNDAFAAAHRSQPSLVGFPEHLPSYAGRVMERELDVLGSLDAQPNPQVYVLGGAKVSDSIDVARSVLDRGVADSVLTAGVVGNAFLLAAGIDLGSASAAVVNERATEAVREAGELLEEFGHRIHMPRDVAVKRDGRRVELSLDELPPENPALDVGARTISAYADILEEAGTAVLNGPAGVFEKEEFATGTKELYRAATRAGYSVVGGGDTAAALRRLGIEGFSHVSTGGGACLRMLTGEPLPAVEALDHGRGTEQ